MRIWTRRSRKNGHNKIKWVYFYLYGMPAIKIWFAPKTAYRIFPERIFRPGRKIVNVRAYSKFVKNNWLPVRWSGETPNFGLKWTKDELLHSRFYAQCRSALGGRRLSDFLLATNQRAQFRLRHNLGYVTGLATLIDPENIAQNQHSYTV